MALNRNQIHFRFFESPSSSENSNWSKSWNAICRKAAVWKRRKRNIGTNKQRPSSRRGLSVCLVCTMLPRWVFLYRPRSAGRNFKGVFCRERFLYARGNYPRVFTQTQQVCESCTPIKPVPDSCVGFARNGRLYPGHGHTYPCRYLSFASKATGSASSRRLPWRYRTILWVLLEISFPYQMYPYPTDGTYKHGEFDGVFDKCEFLRGSNP